MEKRALLTPPASASALGIDKTKAIILGTIGGLAAAGGMDYIIHDGKYDEVSKGRVANGILNAILGGGAAINYKNPGAAVAMIGGMVGKDLALSTLPLVTEANKTLKEINSDKTMKYLPGIAAGATLGVSAAAIPALVNVSRAADRIADGKSLRTSTMIRRRPGKQSDMVIAMGEPENGNFSMQPKEKSGNTLWDLIFG